MEKIQIIKIFIDVTKKNIIKRYNKKKLSYNLFYFFI